MKVADSAVTDFARTASAVVVPFLAVAAVVAAVVTVVLAAVPSAAGQF
jgi:hypothetical protein